MPERERRSARNCDGVTATVAFDWAPELDRCPWSQLKARVWEAVGWWRTWRSTGSLPWGGTDLSAQPYFVAQVIERCEAVLAEVEGRAAAQERAEIERQRGQG